jgi:hypothetical protein
MNTNQKIIDEAIFQLNFSLSILGVDTCLEQINLGNIENFVIERKALLKAEILSVFKSKYVYSDTGEYVVFDDAFFEYTLNVKANNVKQFNKAYLENAHADNIVRYHRILFESNIIRPAAE